MAVLVSCGPSCVDAINGGTSTTCKRAQDSGACCYARGVAQHVGAVDIKDPAIENVLKFSSAEVCHVFEARMPVRGVACFAFSEARVCVGMVVVGWEVAVGGDRVEVPHVDRSRALETVGRLGPPATLLLRWSSSSTPAASPVRLCALTRVQAR